MCVTEGRYILLNTVPLGGHKPTQNECFLSMSTAPFNMAVGLVAGMGGGGVGVWI